MRGEDENDAFVIYDPAKWVHRYSDAAKIKPFPWKGSQGWTILTEEQKKQIQLF